MQNKHHMHLYPNMHTISSAKETPPTPHQTPNVCSDLHQYLLQQKDPPHWTILKNNITSTNPNMAIIAYNLCFFFHAFCCNSFNSRCAFATFVLICHVSSFAFCNCCRWACNVAKTVLAVVSAWTCVRIVSSTTCVCCSAYAPLSWGGW